MPEVHDYDRTKPNQQLIEPFEAVTYYTYRYDIGTRQHLLNAQNKAEALRKFRSDYGASVRAQDVHRASWSGWRKRAR